MDKQEAAQWVMENTLSLEDAWLKLICCDHEGDSISQPDKQKRDVVLSELDSIDQMMADNDHSYDLCAGPFRERVHAQTIILEAGV